MQTPNKHLAMAEDGAADARAAAAAAKSEAELVDFMGCLNDYVPAIPDELADYHLNAVGFESSDPLVRRLLAVATQKFVAEIARDAMQYCKMRQVGAASRKGPGGRDRKMIMRMEDLATALKEYGVHVKRQEYFVDTKDPADSSTADNKEE